MADANDARAKLRAATEEHVEMALEDGNFGSDVALADAPELLEFFNRMLDILIGEDGD